jgi:hypothetical protein
MPRRWPRWSEAGFAAGFAGLGALVAWVATGPALDVFVNWDTGVYLHAYASGAGSWQDVPWNCHFGLGHLYDPAVRLARAVGGTPVQGLRFLNALALAAAAAVMADGLRRAVGGRLIAGLLALVWLTAFATALPVLTLEDDVLWFPAAAVVTWLLLVRLPDWGWRDSAAAGVAVGFAALMSWQAVIWLGPACYATAIADGAGRPEGPGRPGAAPGRPAGVRAVDTGVLLGSFVALLVLWTLAVAALAPARGAGELLAVLVSRPEPSLFPRDAAGLGHLLAGVGAMLRTLGIAMCRMLRPWAALPGEAPLRVLGGVALAAMGALAAWSFTRRGTPAGRRLHAAAASLLLLAVVTSYYQAAEGDNVKRYAFAPFLAVAVLASLVEAVGSPRALAGRAGAVVMALLAAASVAQAGIAARWRQVTLRTPPAPGSDWVKVQHPAPPLTADGRRTLHQSWYGYLDRVRRERPGACQHVFTADELAAGRWWAEIPALLWSELPAHAVLAEPGERAGWRRAPRFVTRAELAASGRLGCAWLSPAAARLVARPRRPRLATASRPGPGRRRRRRGLRRAAG